MRKFYAGQELWNRSVCDHNCIFSGKVIKRNEKTIRVSLDDNPKKYKTCKIHHDDAGNEFIFPYGRYSMAPIFRAP